MDKVNIYSFNDECYVFLGDYNKLESNWKALKEWLEKDAFKNLESKGIALTTDEVLNQMAKIELEGDK